MEADRPPMPCGPSVLSERDIEADRKAWEDDQPPYDDAYIASLEADSEAPPFEAPDAEAVDAKEVLQNIWGNVVFKSS